MSTARLNRFSTAGASLGTMPSLSKMGFYSRDKGLDQSMQASAMGKATEQDNHLKSRTGRTKMEALFQTWDGPRWMSRQRLVPFI